MGLFENFYFFGFVLIAAIPAVILGIWEKPLKWYIMAVSLFFIWAAMKDNMRGVAYMSLFCSYEVILIEIYIPLVKRYGRRRWLFWAGIVLAVAPLTMYKISSFYLGGHIFGFLGISYMTFKAVQIIIETYDGLIEHVKIGDVLQLFLFFPTVLSGPIDRSRRFSDNLNHVATRSEYIDMLGDGLMKIVMGMLYKFTIAVTFYEGMVWLGNDKSWLSIIIYMYCYGFYLFFDFAGYSQMAIGVSYLFGIRTPENFNKPFISKDIKEFWDRWHITLSHWFRDFIFSRFTMSAMRGKWFANKLTTSSLAFMINMTVMGVWHGLDSYYILYGVYHGILLSLNEIYQKKCKFHKKYKKARWYQLISWFITFNLVMFGFFIFSGRFTEIVSHMF